MGGISSKDFEEMLEEAPPTPLPDKKLLDTELDPRSPTVGITRTPILLEKSQEQVLDPRSPTAGIVRTPIFTEHGPREETVGVPQLSPTRLAFSDDMISWTATADSLAEESQEASQDEFLLQTKVFSDSEPVTDHSKLIKSVSESVSKKESVKKKTSKTLFKGHTNMSPGSMSPAGGKSKKDMSPRSPLRLIGDSQRPSPLSKRNIHVDSPRAIVQRKQATKLGIRKESTNSPSRYLIFHDEQKENVTN